MSEQPCTAAEYRERITHSLYQLQKNNILCDAKFITSDGPIHVHRIILAVCDSTEIKQIISSDQQQSSNEETSIPCEAFSSSVVNSLIQYLYTGEINVKNEHNQEFGRLCKFFKLEAIAKEFLKYDHESSDKDLLNFVKNTNDKQRKRKTNVRKGRKPVQKKPKTEPIENDLCDLHVANDCHGDGDDQSIDNGNEESSDLKEIPGDENSPQSMCKTENITNLNNIDTGFNLEQEEKNPYYESPEPISRKKLTQLKGDRKTKLTRKRKEKVNKKDKKLPIKLTVKLKKKIQSDTNDQSDENQLDESFIVDETADEKDDDVGEVKTRRKRKVIYRWCRKCQVRFPEKEQRKHLRTKHPPYVCKLCDWSGLLSRELALHMYNKHQMLVMQEKYPLLQCDHEGCDFTTLVSYALDRHKECHNRVVRHLCDVCGSSFATAGGLKEHSLRHADENPIYKCQQCDAVFGWKCKLKSHENKMHGTYMLCEICPYKTKYKNKLIMHLHRAHDQPIPSNQKVLRCDQCDFYCINSTKLRFHKLRHEGVKNHSCSHCGKSYFNAHQLKIHFNSTHGDRRFNCHICNYTSKRKSELNNHIKSRHSEDRPFSCNLCEYSCKLRGNLQKHIRMVHKVEVVTRNQLHKNMLSTGKGYMQLLDAMQKDEIILGDKVDAGKQFQGTTSGTENTQISTNSSELNSIHENDATNSYNSEDIQRLTVLHDHVDPALRRNVEVDESLRRNIDILLRRGEGRSSPAPVVTTLDSPVYQFVNNNGFQPYIAQPYPHPYPPLPQ